MDQQDFKKCRGPVFAVVLLAATAAGASPVIDAVKAGDAVSVQALIKKRADVNATEVDGSTALLWAVYRSDLDMVRALLAAKADVNAANRYDITPLLQACRIGNVPIVEALLKAGADPQKAVRRGETPLMAAAGSGSLAIVELLLAKGADVNAKEVEKGQPALMWAAAEGHLAIVQKLLAAGADPNLSAHPIDLREEAVPDQGRNWSDHSRGGLTALMYAAREGHVEVAEALIRGGARLDAKTPNNLTALMIAVINDALDLAALLLDSGADPNDGSLYELVQLHNLRTTSTAADATRPRPDLYNQLDPVALAALYMDKGADPNRPTSHAIHVDGKGNAGASNPAVVAQYAYAAALANKDVRMLRVFLDSKAVDPDTVAPGTMIPLVAAVAPAPRVFGEVEGPYRFPGERNSILAIEALLAAGADVNGATTAGETALHRAAQIGDLQAIELLAKQGAKLDVQNKAGLSPLDLAMGKRPPPDPQARPGPGGPRRDGPQPEAVVLLRQLMGLPALPADQLPRGLPATGAGL